MSRVRGLLVFLLPLLPAVPLEAASSSTRSTTDTTPFDYIILNPSGFPSHLGTAVSSGAAQWNATSCNTTGDAFPFFQVGGSASNSRAITVQWLDGMDPDNNRRCGKFEGSTITLYSQARNPSTGLVASCEGTDPNVRADRVAESVAHELGHTLGLNDSSCIGHIMQQTPMDETNAIASRQVQSDECSLADETHLTPSEVDQIEGDGSTGDGGTESDPPPPDETSPIVIDLVGDGFRFTGLDASVLFDIDGDGELDEVSWTEYGSDDSFLVYDRTGTGSIDSGLDLFGSVTPQPPSAEPNGFLALAVYDELTADGNADGWISAEDAIFPSLRLWRDANHDGISQPEELLRPEEVGLEAIGLEFRESRRRDRHGNEIRWRSEARFDWGKRPAVVDVIFLSVEEPLSATGAFGSAVEVTPPRGPAGPR